MVKPKMMPTSNNNIIQTTLPSGLTIITSKMEEVESVSINIGVKVGSRYEADHLNGISHFLEHMAFKGTTNSSAQQIAEAFDDIGGYFNAYTAREKTIYTTKVLKNDVKIALDILADVLQNSLYDSEEIAKEYQVILQEIAQCNDTPDDIVFDHFQEAAFSQQAVGKSILGTPEIISSFTTETFKKFVAEHYHAGNMVVTAAGKIDHAEIEAIVARLFENLPQNKKANFSAASYTGGFKYDDRDLEQLQLVVGFEGLSYVDESYYTAQLLAIILGGGMSSRLFQEVREKRGLAYSVGAFTNSYNDKGIFGVYLGSDESKAQESVDVIAGELDKIMHLIEDAELKRAKSQIKASLLMSRESTNYRAEELIRNHMHHGRQILHSEIIAKIENIEKSHIQDLAKTILKNSKPTVAAVGRTKNLYDYDSLVKKFS